MGGGGSTRSLVVAAQHAMPYAARCRPLLWPQTGRRCWWWWLGLLLGTPPTGRHCHLWNSNLVESAAAARHCAATAACLLPHRRPGLLVVASRVRIPAEQMPQLARKHYVRVQVCARAYVRAARACAWGGRRGPVIAVVLRLPMHVCGALAGDPGVKGRGKQTHHTHARSTRLPLCPCAWAGCESVCNVLRKACPQTPAEAWAGWDNPQLSSCVARGRAQWGAGAHCPGKATLFTPAPPSPPPPTPPFSYMAFGLVFALEPGTWRLPLFPCDPPFDRRAAACSLRWMAYCRQRYTGSSWCGTRPYRGEWRYPAVPRAAPRPRRPAKHCTPPPCQA